MGIRGIALASSRRQKRHCVPSHRKAHPFGNGMSSHTPHTHTHGWGLVLWCHNASFVIRPLSQPALPDLIQTRCPKTLNSELLFVGRALSSEEPNSTPGCSRRKARPDFSAHFLNVCGCSINHRDVFFRGFYILCVGSCLLSKHFHVLLQFCNAQGRVPQTVFHGAGFRGNLAQNG